MSIILNQPYKIVQRKQKKYEEHYQIPSEKCVIIPVRVYGDDISCDVRWEDPQGIMQIKNKVLFQHQNLELIDPMVDYQLHEIWKHFENANEKGESSSTSHQS